MNAKNTVSKLHSNLLPNESEYFFFHLNALREQFPDPSWVGENANHLFFKIIT